MSTVWKNYALFEKHYCGQFPGKPLYSTFDYAVQDDEGYFFILGRADDVINVCGHRLGTREIEEAIISHPAVAEAAVVGTAEGRDTGDISTLEDVTMLDSIREAMAVPS